MCNSCGGNVFGSLGGLRDLKSTPSSFSRRRFLASAAGAGLLLPTMFSTSSGSEGGTESADTIFHGGPIISMADNSATGATQGWAVAVKGEQIVAIGPETDIMDLKSNATTIVDLQGRTLRPGFIDPHLHSVTGGLIAGNFIFCGYIPTLPDPSTQPSPNWSAVQSLNTYGIG